MADLHKVRRTISWLMRQLKFEDYHINDHLLFPQLVWKRYFTDDGGPGVSLYEVDFGPSEKHSKCVAKFKKNHPDTCDGIYLVNISDA